VSQDEFDLSALQARYERTKGRRRPPAAAPQRSVAAEQSLPAQAGKVQPASASRVDRTPYPRILIAGLSGAAVLGLGVLITLLVKPSFDWKPANPAAIYVEPTLPPLNLPAPRRITLMERIQPNAAAQSYHPAREPSSKTPALGAIVDCEVHTANFEETLRGCLEKASHPPLSLSEKGRQHAAQRSR